MAIPDDGLSSALARARTNGPKDMRAEVERGLLKFDVMTSENELLKSDLAAAREKIRLLELQIEQMESTKNTIESRINDCVLQRDQAVGEAGEVRGVLNAIASICVRYHQSKHETEQG
jgi:BMFP domain-containing protein YqiC